MRAICVPKEKVKDLLEWRAEVKTHIYDDKIGEEVVREMRFIEVKKHTSTYYELQTRINYHWHENGERESKQCGIRFLKCHEGCLIVWAITGWGCNYLYDLIEKGIVQPYGRNWNESNFDVD